MSKVKTQCHVCGFTTKADEPVAVCPQCGADLRNPVELVLKKVHDGFSTGGKFSAKPGMLYLTNLRLFWVMDKNGGVGAGAGGLLGVAVAAAVTAGKTGQMAFSLPLADIATVEDAKVGFGKGLQLVSRTNGPIGIISVGKQQDEWRDAIRSAVAAATGQR
jgi:hypothetical protein